MYIFSTLSDILCEIFKLANISRSYDGCSRGQLFIGTQCTYSLNSVNIMYDLDRQPTSFLAGSLGRYSDRKDATW